MCACVCVFSAITLPKDADDIVNSDNSDQTALIVV